MFWSIVYELPFQNAQLKLLFIDRNEIKIGKIIWNKVHSKASYNNHNEIIEKNWLGAYTDWNETWPIYKLKKKMKLKRNEVDSGIAFDAYCTLTQHSFTRTYSWIVHQNLFSISIILLTCAHQFNTYYYIRLNTVSLIENKNERKKIVCINQTYSKRRMKRRKKSNTFTWNRSFHRSYVILHYILHNNFIYTDSFRLAHNENVINKQNGKMNNWTRRYFIHLFTQVLCFSFVFCCCYFAGNSFMSFFLCHCATKNQLTGSIYTYR